MSVLMVIDQTERELASPCNRLPFANSIRWLLNDIRLNFDQKRSLSLGLGLRWWSVIDKNIKHRHDVGLRTLWRENKFLSTRFLAIFMSFWTHINYFKFLASHLTVFNYLSLAYWDGSFLSIRSIIIITWQFGCDQLWNLKTFSKIVPFTWRFHRDNFPNHSKFVAHVQMKYFN